MKRKQYFKKLAILFLAINSYGYTCIAANYIANKQFYQQNIEKVISGLVVDEAGQPVINALIFIPETKTTVITNKDGKFVLSMPENQNILCISYIGYRTETVTLNDKTDIKVVLKEDIHCQDEMIPVAQMRKETRNSTTGSFSIIKGQELEKYPSAGLSGALTGKLAGLTVLQSSNEPGHDGASLFIRGYNTTSGNQPLFVLDGVPSPTLDINLLDPQTIESVAILKDAAACAVYGFQGSSGVILITTKRGSNGAPKVSVSADFSLQQATVKPDMLHSWEYAQLRNQARKNDQLESLYSATQIQNFQNGNSPLYPDNNWYTMFMKDLTTMQRYNINITGGNERIKYFVNAGFVDQGDLLKVQETEKYNPSKYMQRFNERTNVDIQILPNLSAFLNQMVVVQKTNSPSYDTGSILESIYYTPATEVGPLTPEGGVVVTPWNNESAYGKINRSGYQRYTETTANVALGMNWGMDFITKGLSMKGTIGYESRVQSGIFGNISYARYIKDESNTSQLTYLPYGSWVDSSLSLSKGSNYRYFLNFNGSLNYDRFFNNVHEINAYANYFAQNIIREGGGTQILPYDQIGFNIHAKYGYSNKYYIQADASWMTSDQFHKDRHYGFFPTLSAAWVASNENFIKENVGSWLTLLKLKTSYGKIGNDQLVGYRYMYKDDIRLTSGGYINSLYSGALISESLLGNADLKWEDSYQQNYGINLGLFNSLTLNFDYYIQKTKDILIKNNKIPTLQGLPYAKRPYTNEGEVENRGFELELEYAKQLNKDWHITAAGSVSTNKNKINNVDEINRSSSNYYYPYRQTGYSINQNFGYIIDDSNGNGYFNSEQEIKDSKLVYEGIAPRPGDFIYKDLNNDGVINEQDKAPIGYSTLPRISYAAKVQAKYKNFDLYILLQGVAKASACYSGLGVNEYYGQGTYTRLHQEAWTLERYANGEAISYPALSVSQSSSVQANSFFICNQNYLRIKNVEIGYSLPKEFCRKIRTEKIRFYLNGSNLLTFDKMKFKDLDPESGSLSSYPHYRTYNIGLNIIF